MMRSASAKDIALQTQLSVQSFLHHEATLLDNRALAEWNGLFTDNGIYWVPLSFDQPDAVNHASLFYENAMMREVRIRRLDQVRAWSQHPRTRTARLIGNIVIEPCAGPVEELTVRSTFHLLEWRKGRELRLLGGGYTHTLIQEGGSWRIKLKRVDLIDRDGVHEPFEMFI